MLYQKRFQGIEYGAFLSLALVVQPLVAETAPPAAQPTTVQPAAVVAAPAPGMISAPVGGASTTEIKASPLHAEVDAKSVAPTSFQSKPDDAISWQSIHAQRMAEHKARMERMREMSPQERWEARRAELNARYQELRQRAAESGVALSENPPWNDSGANNAVGSETPSEQRGQAPRPQPLDEPPADDTNPVPPAMTSQDFGDHPDLERMQAIINGMTPAEREVCTTVHRLSMWLTQPATLPATQASAPDSGARYGAYGTEPREPSYRGYGADSAYTNSSRYERPDYNYAPPATPPPPSNYYYGRGTEHGSAPDGQGGGW